MPAQPAEQSLADCFERESGTIMVWCSAITQEELRLMALPWMGFEYKPLTFWPMTEEEANHD